MSCSTAKSSIASPTALMLEAEKQLREKGCTRFEIANEISLRNATSFLRGLAYENRTYLHRKEADHCASRRPHACGSAHAPNDKHQHLDMLLYPPAETPLRSPIWSCHLQ